MSIFNYQSYRDYLRDQFSERINRFGDYSLRAFAAELELAPSILSGILNRKHGISRKKAIMIARKLNLSEEETRYFCNLVERERKGAGLKMKLARRALNQASSVPKTKNLNSDYFDQIDSFVSFTRDISNNFLNYQIDNEQTFNQFYSLAKDHLQFNFEMGQLCLANPDELKEATQFIEKFLIEFHHRFTDQVNGKRYKLSVNLNQLK
jgi:hypothetical protein